MARIAIRTKKDGIVGIEIIDGKIVSEADIETRSPDEMCKAWLIWCPYSDHELKVYKKIWSFKKGVISAELFNIEARQLIEEYDPLMPEDITQWDYE